MLYTTSSPLLHDINKNVTHEIKIFGQRNGANFSHEGYEDVMLTVQIVIPNVVVSCN